MMAAGDSTQRGKYEVVQRCGARHFYQFSVQQFPLAPFLFRKRVELLGRDERANWHMPADDTATIVLSRCNSYRTALSN
jgi:hypothetical protein